MQTTTENSGPNSLPPTPHSLLQVESVSYRYPHFELFPISFEAREGELIAIIGPNGSGKSTLLDIASGHLKSLTSRITLEGRNLKHLATGPGVKREGLLDGKTTSILSLRL